jgi:Fe-S-cluster containining protein
MRTVRIAILGASPCPSCHAACCRQNGHEFAAVLSGDEARKFKVFAVQVRVARDGTFVTEQVLPYVDGKCRFLGADDRCTIYDDRPSACRKFECVPQFHPTSPGTFLRRNPDVLRMLKAL